MVEVKTQFPEVHFCMGLSNISFGLPVRPLVNRVFLTIAMNYGLDSAILDPLDKDLMSAIFATEMVLNQDDFCVNYTKAFRQGQLKSERGLFNIENHRLQNSYQRAVTFTSQDNRPRSA